MQKIQIKQRPMTLIILDGWGYSEAHDFNAISNASKPNWEHAWENYPHTLIGGSGLEVGLPENQMGNSEVGHLNLGAGRVVFQEVTRVNKSIKSSTYYTNPVLTDALDFAIEHNSAVHIMGLLSKGGVHSHEDHFLAMLEMAIKRGATKVYLHAFLDGRDSAPKSAAESILRMEDEFSRLKGGQFASLIGRYYAMDRDHRWMRTQEAYDLMTSGEKCYSATSAMEALDHAYIRGETDEFVSATRIGPNESAPILIQDNDVVMFMNYRADRARQITRAFIEPQFGGFVRNRWPQTGRFVSMTQYSANFDIPVAFPSEPLNNVFGEVLSNLGLHQLRIAETEKYAHVTFFLNGGHEAPFKNEDRILIPSPDVATYDQQPEMNAEVLTDRLVEAIQSTKYDVVICNYANPDMLGHTGNYDATIKAIETIDRCLGRVIDAVQSGGGELLITADHGNAEKMRNMETGQPHTAHTSNPVPLIYIGRKATMVTNGALSDVVPTMMALMGLEKPNEMTGRSLVTLD